jgi:hypothetical protein
VFVRQPPPDTTPPTVSDTQINAGAAIATATAATVTFNAADPTSPGAAPTTGVSSFCLVRYTFNQAERRWVEEACNSFTPLPTANSDGSFTVATTLRARAGTAYVFVWVKDAAGNISRTPGFDAISFVPGPTTDIELERNDVRLFRITLAAGQSVSMTFTPTAGDVDISVFQGINSGASRIQVSAQNGLTPESVSFTAPAGQSTTFQVEVRAVVNSVFSIGVSQSLAAASQLDKGIAPGKEISATPMVAGPPALQTAIEEPNSIYVPLVSR